MRDKTKDLLAALAAKLIEKSGGDIEGARSEFKFELRDYYESDSEDESFADFTQGAAEVFIEAERLDANREAELLAVLEAD